MFFLNDPHFNISLLYCFTSCTSVFKNQLLKKAGGFDVHRHKGSSDVGFSKAPVEAFRRCSWYVPLQRGPGLGLPWVPRTEHCSKTFVAKDLHVENSALKIAILRAFPIAFHHFCCLFCNFPDARASQPLFPTSELAAGQCQASRTCIPVCLTTKRRALQEKAMMCFKQNHRIFRAFSLAKKTQRPNRQPQPRAELPAAAAGLARRATCHRARQPPKALASNHHPPAAGQRESREVGTREAACECV